MPPYTLTVTDTALKLTINSEENLLEQCLATKLPVARSCRNGNCGRCDCLLEAGSVILRTGNQLLAPCTIALCISHAHSNLSINHLPLANRPQHWRCEGLNSKQVRLPAGRQSPPNEGDIVAVLLSNTVVTNSIAGVDGRVITLQEDCLEITHHLRNQRSIALLNIDREHAGSFSLWHSVSDQQTLLWPSINQTTGIAAQAAYRHGNSLGHFQLRNINRD
jgi:ferredoxin